MLITGSSIKRIVIMVGPALLIAAVAGLRVMGQNPNGAGSASSPAAYRETYGLDEGWHYRRVGEEEWHEAAVPGCVHRDLLANGLIEEPFFGDNEERQQWIELEDWEYRTIFDLSPDMLEHDRIDLVFEGLDTYADVFLNDSLVLRADNMFREWRIDCAGLARDGRNELRVIFRSAVRAVEEEWRSLGAELPGGPRVLTRKAAYQYGWDWAPRFVTCGIWRPVRLEAWSGARIVDFHIDQLLVFETNAVLRAEIEIESTWLHEAAIGLYRYHPEDGGRSEIRKTDVWLPKGRKTITFDFKLLNPELWWPNGMGDSYLYRFMTRLEDPGLRDEKEENVGIRTVELVTEQDETGESFRFEVNGVPIFMKGANWVPLDAFPGGIDESRYEAMIQSVAAANMNMLRVWGGGFYESDLFYDLCDEEGILVWQDFMFACAMYPGGEAFLENVRAEAEGVVRRLRNHPCVALWCGNNESAEGWRNWGWQRQHGYSPADSIRVWRDYERLFHELLPRVVTELDGSRAYIPSSPRHGRADPRSLTEGDSHYWGVWHDGEPFRLYEARVGRFMSEYGFQSFPSMQTVAGFAASGDRYLDSDAIRAHQKHPRGNGLIRTYMERDYHVPEDFEDFVYVSQLLQADGVVRAIEVHRRAAPCCMGSLYWQLNDCWPAASWSSVDYNGMWKALHYRARRAFAPELVSVSQTGDTIDVHVVSDRTLPSGWELILALVDFGGEALWEERWPVRVDLCTSAPYRRVPTRELPVEGIADRVVFSAQLCDSDGIKRSRSLHYFVEPKLLRLEKPHIGTTVEYAGIDARTIILTTDYLAKDVYLSLGEREAFFSDNYFDLLPGDTLMVDLYAKSSDLKNLGDRLTVRTLYDTLP